MTNLGNDDYIDLAGAKKQRASMALDRKVGVGSNNDDLDAPLRSIDFIMGSMESHCRGVTLRHPF